MIPAVVNFCSTRADMLAFSTEELAAESGADFDYVLVTWNASPEVLAMAADFERRSLGWNRYRHVKHQTVPGQGYVPNLRAMFNRGFDEAYALSEYACIVNTDMAFGRAWLSALVDRAHPGVIPNSLHLTPVKGPRGTRLFDFGVPTRATFDHAGFWAAHGQLFEPRAIRQGEMPDGWIDCATMPYLVHERWWRECGPWELRSPQVRGAEPPDRRFFRRCAEAGAEFVLCLDSICYHHEAVERRGARPAGTEHLKEDA